MAAQIISFFQHAPSPTRDWSQQETAEFYRVESALVQAGVELESDRGLSDEGDPWFIFCRSDNGEVFIHFARIDGLYVVDGAAFETPARGRDFAALVRGLIARYPLAEARARGNSNIFVHPAALLIALVGAAFFQTSEAKAATSADGKADADGKTEHRRASLIITSPPQLAMTPQSSMELDSGQVAAVLLSAVLTLHGDALPPAPAGGGLAPIPNGDHELLALGVPVLGPLETTSTLPSSTSFDAPVALQAALDKVMISTYSVSTTLTEVVIGDTSGGLLAAGTSSNPESPQEVAASAPILVNTADHSAAKPLFFAKISTGPAPAVEAIAIVVSNATLAELIAKALPQVDRLPKSLLDLIGRGDHLDASAPSLRAPLTAPLTSEDVPAVEGEQPPSSGAPILDTPAPTRPPLPGTPAAGSRDAAIDTAIAAFMSHVKNLDMLMQGNQLVIYNRDIMNPFGPKLELDSVTFTFEDGSSLSLVGTALDLSHSHWAV